MTRETNEAALVITDTERKLLELLVTGASSKSIADQLGLKDGTTRVYLHSLYKRIGVNNKTSAVTWYLDTQRQRSPEVIKPATSVETFGDRAVERDLDSALGMMEVFLGPYGRMWDMLVHLEGQPPLSASQHEIRVRARRLWGALTRGDFTESATFFDREGVAKLFIESQSDAVVLTASLVLGGYSVRASKALASLKLKRGGSIGITVDEKAALTAIGDVVNESAVDSGLAALHRLAERSLQRPVFRHLLIVALFHLYKGRKELRLARDVGNAIWAEAEAARTHLESSGDMTFPPNARIPEPPRLPKADVTRYLASLTG
jgi:DNA-binding CsgD family transcriptional regulator